MKDPTIVFLDKSTLGDIDNIDEISILGKFIAYDETQLNLRIERSAEAHVLITNKVLIDKELIDACPNLKLICVAATGMNNVDLEYAEKNNIVVKNVAGYSTDSVAQSTISMLLYLVHRSRYYDEYVKSGEYIQSPVFTHMGPAFWELKNKIFGIIGLGAIGKRVAELASAFGSKIVYYSTSGTNIKSVYEHRDLATLLKISDIVSVHCPLNENTKNLISMEELRLMKREAFLLNMGRGGIVNEEALSQAIDQEIIAGAALDVLSAEPAQADNPLMHVKKKDRLFITPHIAWASVESRRVLVSKIARNIKEFLR